MEICNIMIIKVKNLCKKYKVNIKDKGKKFDIKRMLSSNKTYKTAIDNVSFEIDKGMAVACIGENGAGARVKIRLS